MDPRESQQWQSIQKCLSGESKQECSWCQHHYSKNGQCCFGIRYEYGHRDCEDCTLIENCAALTQQARQTPYQQPRVVHPGVRTVTQPGQPVRVSVGYNRTPPQYPYQPPPQPYQTTYSAPQYQQQYYGPQQGQPLVPLYQFQPSPVEFDNPNWKKHLVSLLGWGMAEGGLELVLHWFRNRRPRPT